ncbi:hypothetical protein SARC_16968, partial [Sphaeroforma arctica JP610]
AFKYLFARLDSQQICAGEKVVCFIKRRQCVNAMGKRIPFDDANKNRTDLDSVR